MKLLLLADSHVGSKTFDFIWENYPDDIGFLITMDKNEIWLKAEERGIDVGLYNNETIQQIQELDFEIGLLAWWPKIIKNELISLPENGFINFHPGYLPYNRGKHYNFWAIVEEAPFGVTIHMVDEGIDTGSILAQKKIAYDWEDTGETLYLKAQGEMFDLFYKTYPDIRESKLKPIVQDLDSGSFHHSSEISSASRIDLDKKYTARQLLNLMRARTFAGYPGCYFDDKDGNTYELRIKITKVNK